MFLPVFAIAQDIKGIDSLKHKLSIATNDTSRVLLMLDINYKYREQHKIDSGFIYGQQALNLSQRIKFLKGEAEADAIKARATALAQNQNLVELIKAERWNGQLPTTVIPGNVTPFLSIPNKEPIK